MLVSLTVCQMQGNLKGKSAMEAILLSPMEELLYLQIFFAA